MRPPLTCHFTSLTCHFTTLPRLFYNPDVLIQRPGGEMAGVCAGTLRLPKPPGMNDELFELLQACWASSPAQRPTFRDIRWRLQQVGGGGHMQPQHCCLCPN